MKGKDLLIILNPRRYEPSLKSLKALNIPKVWITGYTEKGAVAQLNKIVEETNYQHYITQSDDVIVKQEQIDAITNNNKDYDILSGWCNLVPGKPNVNVCPVEWGKKLTLSSKPLEKPWPLKEDYPFYDEKYTYENIMNKIDSEIFETYNIGFSFTSFKRKVLLEYPLDVYTSIGSRNKGNQWVGKRETNFGSDHHISHRIVSDGKYKMYVHKKAFFEHLKLKKTGPGRFQVGAHYQKITWEI